MWEAYDLKNEDFLWAGTAFRGGIAGQQQATCGAVAGGALALGLKNRYATADKEKVERAQKAANEDAAEMVKSFIQKFGAVSCIGLTGVDFSDEKALKKAVDSGLFEEKCHKQAQFVIEKLYELEKKRSSIP
jgi:C_GCAxxG_C_C family probable redox protein